VPADAKTIDLGSGNVAARLIDSHTHLLLTYCAASNSGEQSPFKWRFSVFSWRHKLRQEQMGVTVNQAGQQRCRCPDRFVWHRAGT